jgi:hypothetical protein
MQHGIGLRAERPEDRDRLTTRRHVRRKDRNELRDIAGRRRRDRDAVRRPTRNRFVFGLLLSLRLPADR